MFEKRKQIQNKLDSNKIQFTNDQRKIIIVTMQTGNISKENQDQYLKISTSFT